MVVCEVCRKSINPSQNKVKCNGPCVKAFHLLCADLNKTYGRALAAKVGLYWFCTECRTILDQRNKSPNQSVTLTDVFKMLETVDKKLGENNSGEPSTNAVTDAVSALELLPEEIWLKVFQSLNGSQLRQIRMTCRSWNQIVGSSPSVMKKLVLRVSNGIVLDQNCEEAELLLACNSRYLHIVLNQIRIIQVNTWWPFIAENLESLSISKSQITINTLLTMLEPLHNLKSLTFSCGPFVNARNCPTRLNFKLPSLETLVLEEVDQIDLLDVFKQLCPRLKVLKIPSGSCTETHPQKVVKLVDAVKGTLQEVEFPMSTRLWQMLNAIDGIRLQGISLSKCNEQSAMKDSHLINLSQKYSTIKSLSLSSSEMTLEAIGKNLTDLERIRITLRGRTDSVSTTFLHQMLNLNHLDINGGERYYGNAIDFMHCRNNSLKVLHLGQLNITKSFSNAFSYVSHLNLYDCRCPTWSYIFDSAMKSLQHITLKSIRVENEAECLAEHFNNLKFLSITSCDISKSTLIALFSLCPNLSELKLHRVDKVDDDVVLKICKKLSKLKSLSITDCYKTTKLAKENIEMLRSQIGFYHYDNNAMRSHSAEYILNHCDSDYEYSD